MEQDAKGRFFTLHSAQLRKDSLMALAPIKESKKTWGIRTAYVFATDEGAEILEKFSVPGNNAKRIVFTLSVTDGLSNTKVVQQVDYRLEDVRRGRFGVWLDIEETAQSSSKISEPDDEGDFTA